jgi:hypothetical protein
MDRDVYDILVRCIRLDGGQNVVTNISWRALPVIYL